MALIKDIWRVGVAQAPVETLTQSGALSGCQVSWLPSPGSARFLADPFGLWRDGRLYVFVEAYDYRDRHGTIEVLTLDAELRILAHEPVLREPWHLSYPFVFEADGDTWMAPEGFRSGLLTLYRAVDFPTRWEPCARLELDAAPIDATPLFHDGLWWLFYTPAGSKADKVSALHIAFAERLTGPWRPHAGNPVVYDAGHARPGGRPFRTADGWTLPVQDCRRTYGGAIRLLQIRDLTPDRFVAEPAQTLSAPASFAPFTAGFHTLSAAGPVTLIDAKREIVTPLTVALDLRRAAGRLSGR